MPLTSLDGVVDINLNFTTQYGTIENVSTGERFINACKKADVELTEAQKLNNFGIVFKITDVQADSHIDFIFYDETNSIVNSEELYFPFGMSTLI